MYYVLCVLCVMCINTIHIYNGLHLQQSMNSKVMKTENLDNTKITSMLGYKMGELSDMTRAYRREEMVKKKLKAILETNANLERQIKNHQNQIKDERGSISFQLNQLTREMSAKFTNFMEEKLQRNKFDSNSQSHKSIQQMMLKYEAIQKECKLLKKTFDSLSQIHMDYYNHSKAMEDIVITMEQNSKDYEKKMDDLLSNINEEIKGVTQVNSDIQFQTQGMLIEIQKFDAQVISLKAEEGKVRTKIQKLKVVAAKQQKKVDEIKEWAEIVIDKNNRKQVYQITKQKEIYLQTLQNRNRQLEIYLCQLETDEERMQNQLNQKQNHISTPKSRSKGLKNGSKHIKTPK